MFEWLASPEAWIALGTLTALEIVLGTISSSFPSWSGAYLPISAHWHASSGSVWR